MRSRANRFWTVVWMAAVLLMLMWFFSPIETDAHDEPVAEVTMCQAEDEFGAFTFPIGELEDLFILCNEVDGVLVTVDDPGPDEMVRIMWEFGLYNPYWITEQLFFGDDDEEPTE